MFSKALSNFTSNISSNYSLSPQPSGTAGPWKIFEAKHKKTNKLASVFVFDPKSLVPQGGSLGGRGNAASLKRAHEEVSERLKREAASLARLRHPSILELHEPIEETRNGGLMFATEPVTASLAGLLLEKDEQERNGGVGGRGSRYVVEEADGTRKRRELEIDELEIQKGLLQLGKGLEFLHESAGLVHANLTPDAVLINAKGDWKISGLSFCGPHESSTAATSTPPISLHEVLNHDPRLPKNVQLNIDYTSPDFVLDNQLTASADMFSLGLVIVALYNSPHTSPLSTGGSLSSYKRLFASSSSIPTQGNNFLVPKSHPLPQRLVSELLPRLITRRPAQRLSAREFQEASYFDNILVSTIRFLDALPAKTPNEKAAFLRGLPRIMPQFPKSVLEKKVLPALLEEMKDKDLLAPIMTNVFAMVKAMPTGKRAFSTVVVPRLREVFITNRTAEKDASKEAGLKILLENMETAAENCSGKEFRDDILPIILLALESPTHGIEDAALGTLPYVLPVLDFTTIKNELFPVIAAVFAKTSSLTIKIKGLEAFYTLCGGSRAGSGEDDDLNGIGVADKRPSTSSSAILDKFTVQEKVVPLLKGIKTKEPGVMMAALRVFQQVGEVADSDFLAMDVLPILWSMSLGPLLNLQQFQAFMTLIKGLGSKIEREQVRKLQELSSSNATVGLGSTGRNRVASGAGGANGLTNGEEPDFETLVSGRRPAAQGNDDLMNDWGAPAARPSAGGRMSSQSRLNDAPTFSWQSTSSAATAPTPPAPQQRALGALAAPQQMGRTVTPDQTLGGFAALTPESQYSQPLQPSLGSSSAGFNASLPVRPAQQPSTSTATSIDWSTAASNSASAWSAQLSKQVQSPSSNSFGAVTRPTTGGFSLPPPPTSPNAIGAFRPPAPQQSLAGTIGSGAAQPAKAGLDRYESLL
jgi:SCY1-like protein 2